MKRIIFISSILVFFSVITFSCSNNETESTEQQAEKAAYQCPMKCEGDKTYDKPGQCPKCNMDLEKVE